MKTSQGILPVGFIHNSTFACMYKMSFPITVHWGPFHYPIKRPVKTWSRQISGLNGRVAFKYDELLSSSAAARQISERLDNLKHISHGFETLRDLTIRRLIVCCNVPPLGFKLEELPGRYLFPDQFNWHFKRFEELFRWNVSLYIYELWYERMVVILTI